MIIIPQQNGFVAGRSTCTKLMVYHHYLANAVESGYQVDAMYTNFRKAFDPISHSILISKLQAMGFSANLLSWLSSFIICRFQIIKFNQSLSYAFKVSSGVPQGSHLRPLLFLLFISDISICFKFYFFLLFADLKFLLHY